MIAVFGIYILPLENGFVSAKSLGQWGKENGQHFSKTSSIQDNMERQCIGIKKDGVRCSRNGSVQTVRGDGGLEWRCGTHQRKRQQDLEDLEIEMADEAAAGPIVEGRCATAIGPNRRCGIILDDGVCELCAATERARVTRAAARVATQQQRVIQVRVREEEIRPFVQAGVAIAIENDLTWVDQTRLWYNSFAIMYESTMGWDGMERMSALYFRVLMPTATKHLARNSARMRLHALSMEQFRPAEEAVVHPAAVAVPPRNTLAAIAVDRQSVHTWVVSKQTNEGVAKLLAEVVPESQQTMMEIWNMWTCSSKQKYNPRLTLMLFGDMLKWYETSTCKTTNDFLYKKLIDGLWARVQRTEDKELRAELRLRVAQEVVESEDMCCEGHISRLVNVLVGFDDAFKAPVSVGEILQQKMAAIVGKEIETEVKQSEARSVFAELGIPVAEQAAWLEAF